QEVRRRYERERQARKQEVEGRAGARRRTRVGLAGDGDLGDRARDSLEQLVLGAAQHVEQGTQRRGVEVAAAGERGPPGQAGRPASGLSSAGSIGATTRQRDPSRWRAVSRASTGPRSSRPAPGWYHSTSATTAARAANAPGAWTSSQTWRWTWRPATSAAYQS